MHVPGAAMVWLAPAWVKAKLEKPAKRSSRSVVPQAGAAPVEPGRPSESVAAVTVSTCG
jgi:hypothetical protein